MKRKRPEGHAANDARERSASQGTVGERAVLSAHEPSIFRVER